MPTSVFVNDVVSLCAEGVIGSLFFEDYDDVGENGESYDGNVQYLF